MLQQPAHRLAFLLFLIATTIHLFLWSGAEALQRQRFDSRSGHDGFGFHNARVLSAALFLPVQQGEPQAFLPRLEQRLKQGQFVTEEGKPVAVLVRALLAATLIQETAPPPPHDQSEEAFTAFRLDGLYYEAMLLLSAFLLYRTLARTWSERSGLILAALLLSSSFALLYTIWKFWIMPAMLFLALAIYAWKRWIWQSQGDRMTWLAISGVASSLMVLSYVRYWYIPVMMVVIDWAWQWWRVEAGQRWIRFSHLFWFAFWIWLPVLLYEAAIWGMFEAPTFISTLGPEPRPRSWYFFLDNLLDMRDVQIPPLSNAATLFLLQYIPRADGLGHGLLLTLGGLWAMWGLTRLGWRRGQQNPHQASRESWLLNVAIIGFLYTLLGEGLISIITPLLSEVSSRSFFVLYWVCARYYYPYYWFALMGVAMFMDHWLTTTRQRRWVLVLLLVTVGGGWIKHIYLYQNLSDNFTTGFYMGCERRKCGETLAKYSILDTNIALAPYGMRPTLNRLFQSGRE